MLRFDRGALVRLINESGVDSGFAMYMDLHPPGFLPSNGKQYDGFWHFIVIDPKGQLKYLSTHSWTLIPADPDSCNP